MKRLLLFIVMAAAAPVAWGQPVASPAPNEFAQRLDATFDRSRLKSIILKYEMKTKVENEEVVREIFLALDGGKYFIRTQDIGPWKTVDQTVDPPIVTTNRSPNVSYLWGTGVYVVDGDIDQDIAWNIYPAATWNHNSVEAFQDLEEMLHLVTPKSSRCRFRGERLSPGGRTYLFTPTGSAIDVEVTVSDADGDGLAPVRMVNMTRTGKVITDIMWSGWKNYNGIWVPQHVVAASEQETGMSMMEYTLLSVEKVNEPIPARWFMPQFPAGPLAIEDHTVSPPLEMDNIDLDGNPYTGSKEDEMPQDNE